MNPAATSKQEILRASHQLVLEKGLSSVNMRTVANVCGVAVGCIYNYFPSKSDLLTATIENVWMNIFHTSKEDMQFAHFSEAMSWLLQRLQLGSANYPEFFSMHAMDVTSKEKHEGKNIMKKYLKHLKEELIVILKNDIYVREEVFNEVLTPSSYVNYILALILSFMMRKEIEIDSFMKLIENSLY